MNGQQSGGHTPGPWHVRNAGPHWNNPAIPNYRVVRTPTPSGPHGYDVAWSPDGELVAEHVYEDADARLIAAAPDLLAACRDLVSVLPDPDDMEDPDDVVRSRIIRARAAIAKATGATP